MRSFIFICFLAVSLLQGASTTTKIKDSKKNLSATSSAKKKTSRRLSKLAKDIKTTEKDIVYLEKKIDELGRNQEKSEKKYEVLKGELVKSEKDFSAINAERVRYEVKPTYAKKRKSIRPWKIPPNIIPPPLMTITPNKEKDIESPTEHKDIINTKINTGN